MNSPSFDAMNRDRLSHIKSFVSEGLVMKSDFLMRFIIESALDWNEEAGASAIPEQ
jgi:hypothetical protein